jgi:hypothetical protein
MPSDLGLKTDQIDKLLEIGHIVVDANETDEKKLEKLDRAHKKDIISMIELENPKKDFKQDDDDKEENVGNKGLNLT